MSRRRSQRAKRAPMNLPGPLGTLQTRLVDAWHQRAVSLKALSFATVGVINTAVDLAFFLLMLKFVTSSQAFVDVVTWVVAALGPFVTNAFAAFLVENAPLITANVAAWLVAVTGSYVMNSFTTFSAETGGKLRLKDYAGFVGSGIVAVIATTTTVVIAAQFMPVLAAKGLAILVSFAVNFSITHFVVFRPRTDATEEPR
jgi:putative flippase GtrA